MTFTEAPRDAGRGRVAEAAATAAGRTLPTYLFILRHLPLKAAADAC